MSSRARVLAFIHGYFADRGLAPSVREISDGVALAPSTVHRLLGVLEDSGELVRVRGVARGLVVDAERQRTAGTERDDYLYELAVSFEYAAAHEVEFVPDDHEIDGPVLHALNAAAFKGVALGIREALGLPDDE
jgi:SOS-response transcriptional repressor LexA